MCREVRLRGQKTASFRHYRADELDKFETHDLETLAHGLRRRQNCAPFFERAGVDSNRSNLESLCGLASLREHLRRSFLNRIFTQKRYAAKFDPVSEIVHY